MEERDLSKFGAKKKTNKTKDAVTSQLNGHIPDTPEQINGEHFEYEDNLEVLETFLNGADTDLDDFGERHNGVDDCHERTWPLRSVEAGTSRVKTENCSDHGRKFIGQNTQNGASIHQRGYSRNVCDTYRHENDWIFGRTRGGILRNDNQLLVVAHDEQSSSARHCDVNGEFCNTLDSGSSHSSSSVSATLSVNVIENGSVIAPLATPESFSDDENCAKPTDKPKSCLTNGDLNSAEKFSSSNGERVSQEGNNVEIQTEGSAVSEVSSCQTLNSFDDDSKHYLETGSLGDCVNEANKNESENCERVPNGDTSNVIDSESIPEIEDKSSTKMPEDSSSNTNTSETTNTENENKEEELEYTSDISDDMDEGNCFDEVDESVEGHSNTETEEQSNENVLEIHEGEQEVMQNGRVVNEQQTEDDSGNNDDIGDFIEADLPPNVERLVFFSRDSSSDEDEGCGDEVLPNNDEDVVSDNETVYPTGGIYVSPVRTDKQKVRNDSDELSSHGACNILSDVDRQVRAEMSFDYLYPCNISCDKSTEENDLDNEDDELEHFRNSFGGKAVECAACNSQNDGNSSFGDRNSGSFKGDNLCACCDRPMEVDCQRQKEMGVSVCDQCFREHNCEQNRWSENLFGARRKSRPSSGSNSNFLHRNSSSSFNPLNNNYEKVSNNSPLYARFSSSDSDPFERVYVSDSSEISPDLEGGIESVFQPPRSPDETMATVRQVILYLTLNLTSLSS